MNHEDSFWDLIGKIAAIGGVFAFLGRLIGITNRILIWVKEERDLCFIVVIIRSIVLKIQVGKALIEDPRITEVNGKIYGLYRRF